LWASCCSRGLGRLDRVADDRREADGELDGGQVAAGLAAVSGEQVQRRLHFIELAARVPGVAMTCHDRQRLLRAAAADQDRQV
jgi:hypothetical protein